MRDGTLRWSANWILPNFVTSTAFDVAIVLSHWLSAGLAHASRDVMQILAESALATS